MSNALAKYDAAPPALVAVSSIDDVMRLGELLSKSGFFSDSTQAAQAFVKILAGGELGMGPIASMQNFHVVKGKLTLSANALAQMVKTSGRYDYRVRVSDAERCEIEFFQNGESLGIEKFTITDARKAGTQNLEKFPKNMLFARAMSNGVKFYCPDVVRGTQYTPEEIDTDESPRPQLRVVEPAPESPSAKETPVNGVALISEADAEHVGGLWDALNKVNGTEFDIKATLLTKKGWPDLYSIPASDAPATIALLEKKLIQAQAKASGWNCSPDSQAVLESAIVAAESAGIGPEMWQEELKAQHDTDSLASLTDQQATDFSDLLAQWAAKKRQKQQLA